MKKCYLCGTSRNITKDHIPPESFFLKPKPTNLITVSCCNTCNNSPSKDDEAARVFLSFDTYRSEAGEKIWTEKVLKSSFKRSPKLRGKVIDSIVKISDEPKLYALKIPAKRMNSFLIRITKGLLFRFHPEINYSNLSFEIRQLATNQETIDFLYKNLYYEERGSGIFRFWRGVAETTQKVALAYTFYNAQTFIVHNWIKHLTTSSSGPNPPPSALS